MIRSKGKILAALLALPCIGTLTAIPFLNGKSANVVSSSNKNTTVQPNEREKLPLCDPFGDMKDEIENFFIPEYSSAAKDFISPSDTEAKSKFPRLIAKGSNTGEWKSITFKQLFIDDSIARAIARDINDKFDINDPVVEIKDGKINKNYLAEATQIDIPNLLQIASSSTISPEQYFSAIFLNPWLYCDSDPDLLPETESSFIKLTEINIENNNLVAIPKNAFTNIINHAASSTLTIDISSNFISKIDAAQFGTNPKKLQVKVRAEGNRINDFSSPSSSLPPTSWFTLEKDKQNIDAWFFYSINDKNNYLISDFISSKFTNTNDHWGSTLEKNSFEDKVIIFSNDLNLYSVCLNKSDVSISYNDWTGKFSVTFICDKTKSVSNDIEFYKDFTETVYLNANTYPFILYLLIIIGGCSFIYSRTKKILKKSK